MFNSIKKLFIRTFEKKIFLRVTFCHLKKKFFGENDPKERGNSKHSSYAFTANNKTATNDSKHDG